MTCLFQNWTKNRKPRLSRYGQGNNEGKVKHQDIKIWKEEINRKTTLKKSKTWKKHIEEETIHDNHPSLIILCKARTNCLPLNNQRSHRNTECLTCGISEDLEHCLLVCPEYHNEGLKNRELQQPYTESSEEIIERFLYKQDVQTRKRLLIRNVGNQTKENKGASSSTPGLVKENIVEGGAVVKTELPTFI